MSFTSLPIEIVHMIFIKLDLNDIVRCRLNKHCKLLVESYLIKNLTVYNSEASERYAFETKLFAFSGDSIELDSVRFRTRSVNFLGYHVMESMLCRLRKLAILEMSSEDRSGAIMCLNRLTGLEHLQIDLLHLNKTLELYLFHIKTFAIGRIISQGHPIVSVHTLILTAPKLHSLALLHGS